MEPHNDWLFKAKNDLGSAEYLLTSKEPFYDIIVYHAQQCAEKSLKAFLAFSDQEVDRTHSLIILTEKCARISNDFYQIIEQVSILNPFSTLYRYPMTVMMPTLKETNQALLCAKEIFQFVNEKVIAEK